MPKNNSKTRRQERKESALEREQHYDTIDCLACGRRHSTEWNCIRQEKLSNGKKIIGYTDLDGIMLVPSTSENPDVLV